MGRSNSIKALEARKLRVAEALAYTKKLRQRVLDARLALDCLYKDGKLSYVEYKDTQKKTFNGRSAAQWVRYYDECLTYYEREYKHYETLLAKEQRHSKAIVSVFVAALLLAFLGFTAYTGFVVMEGENITVENATLVDENTSYGVLPSIDENDMLAESPPLLEENVMIPLDENPIDEPLDSEQSITQDFIVGEQTIQSHAVLGQPVLWNKRIVLSQEVSGVIIDIPANAEILGIKEIVQDTEYEIDEQHIKVNESGVLRDIATTDVLFTESSDLLTGAAIRDVSSDNWLQTIFRFFIELGKSSTGFVIGEPVVENVSLVIQEPVQEVVVAYYTPAPYAVEESTVNGKLITVQSETPYENILTRITIPESASEDIALYKVDNGSREVVAFTSSDTNSDGSIDTLEWMTSASGDTFEIILISDAQHLDINRSFISNIYEKVKAQDDNWSEPIYHDEYVRVRFEQNLTSEKDITVYIRNPTQTATTIEVYAENSNEKITEFPVITDEGSYRVLLTGMTESSDTFDLKIRNNNNENAAFLEFDHIIDPTIVAQRGRGVSEIALAPLSNTSFVIFYNNITSGQVEFQVLNTTGTVITDTTFVDRTGPLGNQTRVAAATINSSAVFFAWYNVTGGDDMRAIYNTNGSRMTTPANNDAGLGSTTDIGLARFPGTTIVQYCYNDITEGDTDSVTFNVETAALATAEINVDLANNAAANQGDDNFIACAAINNTVGVTAWYEATSNDIIYSIVTALNVERVTDKIIDSDVGALAQVAVQGLANNNFVIAWYDATDQDITFAVRGNGSGISNISGNVDIDVDAAAGTKSRIALARVSNATGSYFAIAWYSQASNNIQAAVYDELGIKATSAFVVETAPNPNDTMELMAAVGEESYSNVSLCPGSWALAYNNLSNATVVQTFLINGSVWDGTCVPPAVPNTPPIVTIKFFNSTDPQNRSNGSLQMQYTVTDPDPNVITNITTFFINNAINKTFDNHTLPGMPNITGNFTRGDNFTVVLSAYDGTDWSTNATASIIIADAPPEWTYWNVNTTDPQNKTNGTIQFNYTSTDLDGDTQTLVTTWFLNDAMNTTWDNQTGISAAYTTNKDNFTIMAYIWDNNGSKSSNITATVLIVNDPPTVPSQTSPANATRTTGNNQSLTCGSSTDLDSDTIYYVFYADTSNPPTTLKQNATGTTYGLSTTDGSTYWWYCKTHDNQSNSGDSAIRAFTENTAPTISGLNVNTTYTANLTNATVNASFSVSDAESDSFMYKIDWYLNTVWNTTFANQTNISAGNTTKGDNFTAVVATWDGYEWGTNSTGTVIIQNAAPIAPTPTSPANATRTIGNDQTLTCGSSTDVDGDTIYYVFYADTSNPPTTLKQNATGTTYGLSTVDGSTYWWYCKTHDNSTNSGNSLIQAFTENTPPTISGLNVNTTSTANLTNATVNASFSVSDAESDTVRYQIDWYLNNALNMTFANQTNVSAGNTTRGDNFTAIVAVNDGYEWGTNQTSTVIIINDPPSIPNLNLPLNGTNVTFIPALNWSNSTDLDNNPRNYSIIVDNTEAFTSPEWTNTTIKETANVTTEVSITGLANGKYFWKVNATDGSAGTAYSSYRYFTIDNTAPTVTSTAINTTSANLNGFLCINATATDATLGVNVVWAQVVNASNQVANYTMTDTGPYCSGIAGDNIYAAEVQLTATGNWTVNTTWANDTSSNEGRDNFVNLQVEVSQNEQAPTVTHVSLNDTRSIVEGGIRYVEFSAIVNDTNGNINASSVTANFSKTGEATRSNNSCLRVTNDGTGANFTCTVGIEFYDGSGSWQVSVTALDNASNSAQNNTRYFTLQSTTSMNISISSLTFPNGAPGTRNVTSNNDPLTVQNTGNKAYLNFTITGINLLGDTNSNTMIPAANFTVGNYTGGTHVAPSECTNSTTLGVRLVNNTAVNIEGANASRGAVAQNSLYFCLIHVPAGLTTQQYSTGGTPNEDDWLLAAV